MGWTSGFWTVDQIFEIYFTYPAVLQTTLRSLSREVVSAGLFLSHHVCL